MPPEGLFSGLLDGSLRASFKVCSGAPVYLWAPIRAPFKDPLEVEGLRRVS